MFSMFFPYSPSSWLMQTAKLFCKSPGKLDCAMWMLLGDEPEIIKFKHYAQ